MVEDVTDPWAFATPTLPDSTWALTKSIAGRNGRETEVIRRSTVAMRRKITPGTKKVRDAMWESEEREEEEGVWKFIPAILCLRSSRRKGGEWRSDVIHVNLWENTRIGKMGTEICPGFREP